MHVFSLWRPAGGWESEHRIPGRLPCFVTQDTCSYLDCENVTLRGISWCLLACLIGSEKHGTCGCAVYPKRCCFLFRVFDVNCSAYLNLVSCDRVWITVISFQFVPVFLLNLSNDWSTSSLCCAVVSTVSSSGARHCVVWHPPFWTWNVQSRWFWSWTSGIQ